MGAAGLSDVPLKMLRGRGEAGSRLAGFVGAMPEDRDVNMLIPVSHEISARSGSPSRGRARGSPGHSCRTSRCA